jgi:hypothetical protein
MSKTAYYSRELYLIRSKLYPLSAISTPEKRLSICRFFILCNIEGIVKEIIKEDLPLLSKK